MPRTPLNAGNGAILPGYPWFQADSNFATPALADLYGSGQTDIIEGKKTLLLRAAYDNLVDVDRSFLLLCLSTRTSNDASVSKIEQLIDKSGAVALLTQKMEALFRKAETALENSSFTPAQREGLREAFALVRQQTQHTGTQ